VRWWCLLLVVACARAAAADDDAMLWLDRMSHAVQTLNYEGTFVYLHDGQLESMRIIHRLDKHGEQERLVSLTGAQREVMRDDKSVTCILPDNKSVVVSKSHPRKPFRTTLPSDLQALSRNYEFEVTGRDRMAGLDSRVISIKPRDDFRYGYRFWIDESNYMMLKSELMDENDRAVEQVMFTNLDVLDSIPPESLRSTLDSHEYTRTGDTDEGGVNDIAGRAQWKVADTPDGFVLVDHQRQSLASGGEQVVHMVFSDGLATVSVYIEKSTDAKQAFNGTSSIGALNAFGKVIENHQITVVGEVPAHTVQHMGASLQRVSDRNP
jgi:sigma-E factor negative regulatory protein RseB